MKITVFTSNSIRHNYLCQTLHEFSSELNIIQEIDTVHIGKNQNQYKKISKSFYKYFKKVHSAQKKIFKKNYFELSKKKTKIINLKMGDLNLLKKSDLSPFLKSDIYIIFGCSFIKGWLANFLIKKKAINIHMGISPYYKGADCNFWAIYEGNTNLVGATIQYLSKDLDNGPILFHAVNEYHSNPFIYTMLSVKSAIIAVKKYLKQKKKVKPTSIRNPSFSKLTKKKSFNDKIIKKFFANKIIKKDFYTNTLIRPFILKRRDFFR